MTRYFMKQVTMMVVAMFLIILLTFVIMHAVPGGPFTGEKKLSTEIEAAMNEKYHLSDPLPLQFVDYLEGVVRGDFGPSYEYPGKTINEFIADSSPVSAKPGGVTIAFVLLAALPMGVCAAVKNGRWQGMLIMVFATVGVTISPFVVASLLIYFFTFELDLSLTYGIKNWKGYILSVITLGGYDINYITRLVGSSLPEVMGQDYVRTAGVKGLSEFSVITSHALRNALIPVITVLGPMIASLMTGSFVIKKIFAIPDFGVHFVNSVSQRDYTTIMGVIIFCATFLIAMTMVVDVFYRLVDPRIKYDWTAVRQN